MPFHEKKFFDLFDFASFFAWTFFKFSGPLADFVKLHEFFLNTGINQFHENFQQVVDVN